MTVIGKAKKGHDSWSAPPPFGPIFNRNSPCAALAMSRCFPNGCRYPHHLLSHPASRLVGKPSPSLGSASVG